MGELKKYDGGVMFSDNDVCDVESLKVRFTPIQSGTGTPSPTNVMPISGYNRFNVKHTGKNVCRLDGWGANNTENYEVPSASNSYGTTVSNTDASASVIITQTKATVTDNPSSYQNGYFVIVSNSLEFDTLYNISFDVTDITSNILDAQITDFRLVAPDGGFFNTTSVNGNRIKSIYKHSKSISSPNSKINQIEVRNCGISCTISNLLITKVVDEDTNYEEYNGENFIVDSPISGKNLVDIYGIGATNFKTIYSKPELTNSYGTSIVVSENNNKVVITQSQAPNTSSPSSYQNGYISLGILGLTFGKTYKVSFMVTDIVSNPLSASLSDIVIYSPSGSGGSGTVYDTNRIKITITYDMYQNKPYRNYFEIRNYGMSCTLSDFMVTEADVEDQIYEPYKKTMYGGYIDFVKGEYVQEWAYETDNGGTWYVTSGGNAYQWGHLKCSSKILDIKSTHWKTTQEETNEDLVGINVNGALYIGKNFWDTVGITPTPETVAAYFQAQKEAGTPLYCCCKLLEPIHHPLTPLRLQTYAGINNIWCEVNGEADIWRRSSKPISTEVEKLDLIGLRRGVLLNAPHTESIENDNDNCAVSFDTDMVAPLKNCRINMLPKQLGSGTPSPSNIRDIVGYSGLDFWNINDNLFIPQTKTVVSNGLTWTVSEDGSVSYEGTPTTFSVVSVGYAYVSGATQIIGKIIGDDSFISFDTLYLYDENDTRITTFNSFEQVTWGDRVATVDISEYPTAYRAVIYLKRYLNDVYMSGKCYVVIKTNSPVITKNNYISLQQIKKNLFNINVLRGLPSNINFSSTVKRIFRPNIFVIGTSGTNYYSPSDVSYSINGNTLTINTSGGYGLGYTFHLKPNTQYTFNATFENEGSQVGVGVSSYSADGTFTMVLEHQNKSGIPLTFTTPSDSDIILITFKASGSDSYRTDIPITNIQLEEGNTATEYTEYTYPTYGGYVDLEKNELIVDTQMVTIPSQAADYDRITSIREEATGVISFWYWWLRNGREGYNMKTDGYLMCDSLDVGTNRWSDTAYNNYHITNYSADTYPGSVMMSYPKDVIGNTQNSIIAYLKEHPIHVITHILDPIHYQLTPQQVFTLRGANNLFTTGDSISSEYWTHKNN